ncbi:flagellar hook protein FlgE [Pontivivens ytuae]|uniref:Flagellar hook protein FlgE n=1 Tax=Pontivivens ytuae TaxID=2789856 RepID=A0A7S9LPW4_9RHOB|nr:flagellar hook-basal body complex protein [Pontivivens ytuae]QPH53109.1 flagellar hook-basal body complex protein [Pontivivens ytuae]
MSISSSMNAGVAGLSVNASRLGAISDNIANSSTFGYKTAETDFASIALEGNNAAYTAGGVTVNTFRNVEAQGSLVTTGNATDISISGRGLLPVTPVSALDAVGDLPLQLVSTGSFEPDVNGVLRTPSGLALLGWPANADGSIPPQPRDSAAGLEPVRVTSAQLAAEATTNISFGANLPASATKAGEPATPLNVGIEYFGNLGTSETLTATFTPTIPGTGQSNTWTLELSDSASTTNPMAHFEITFDDSRTGGGVIDTVSIPGGTPLNGESYDATTGLLSINVGGGPLSIQIGRPGQDGQLTQLSSEFAPIAITKDGAPVGNLSSVEIDENGLMTAIYDTGFSRTLYQVPLADVPNMNGLRALDNQAFALTSESGSMYLWDAGDGPTGTTIGFARENSTTDIAGELTSLIETQRAYSSNAKIIQTVDEMLQETTNIKR